MYVELEQDIIIDTRTIVSLYKNVRTDNETVFYVVWSKDSAHDTIRISANDYHKLKAILLNQKPKEEKQ